MIFKGQADGQAEKMSNNCEGVKELKSDLRGVKFNLPECKVPFEFREPYILSGYRQPCLSARECLHSIFKRCNETVNVWSHVVACVFVVVRSWMIFREHNPLEDAFVYPFLSFAVGSSVMYAMSVGAHLFNSMSSNTRHVCFFFDYAAISVYAFSAGQAFYFYSRPLNSDWIILRSHSTFTLVCVAMSCFTIYSCCMSRHRWIAFKYIFRTGTFTTSFFINTLPYWVRIWDCHSEVDCYHISFPYFRRQYIFFAIAGIANGSRLPERLIPGVFDFCGQSHHFLHILSALGNIDQMTALYLDMLGRRNALESSITLPTFANSLLLTLAVIVANVTVVFWFAFSMKPLESSCGPKPEGKQN